MQQNIIPLPRSFRGGGCWVKCFKNTHHQLTHTHTYTENKSPGVCAGPKWNCSNSSSVATRKGWWVALFCDVFLILTTDHTCRLYGRGAEGGTDRKRGRRGESRRRDPFLFFGVKFGVCTGRVVVWGSCGGDHNSHKTLCRGPCVTTTTTTINALFCVCMCVLLLLTISNCQPSWVWSKERTRER